jgi:ATP-dependent 26S proteasome regulatory subunit
MTSRILSPSAAEAETHLGHLQAELARIDILIRRTVRRWQRAGQDLADGFRGLHVSQAEADMLLQRPFGASWGQIVALDPKVARAFDEAQAQADRQSQALAETARQQGQPTRLERLAVAFGLDRFDLDTLLICLAPTLDLRYERLYAFLQDDVTRKRPRINLVLDLLGGPDPKDRLPLLLRFADDAPLFKHRILDRAYESAANHAPLLSQALSVDPALVAWLLGGYQPHADLGPRARLSWPQENDADALLAGGALRSDTFWRFVVPGGTEGERPIVIFYGSDQTSHQAAARLVAARARRALLTVDLAAVVATGISPLRALRLALRDARLTGAIPCLTGWNACLSRPGDLPASATGSAEGPGQGTGQGAGPGVLEGNSPPPSLLAELCAYPDLVVVAGRTAWQATGIDRDRTLLWFEFPMPAYAQRRALWLHFLGQQLSEVPGEPRARATLDVSETLDIPALAGQFALTTGQIRDAVASARDRAAQRGDAVQNDDLLATARAHSNPRLGTLARKIVPRYTWEDIVLPGDQITLLHEIVATVRGRPLVLDEWGVGQKLAASSGVTMLFSGDPGTGKTMAAEVMASELGLELYKIDLSGVVSKYIGETEKNLERIFGEAQSSNAILFFDEADAIFGKRSEVKDAHDRYANIEISYLLQRMEAYEGVTILATNLRANLDEAFTRRLQFAVDFPFPDEHYRLRIWQTLFPPGVPREQELDFALLARRFKLAGGSIRNILVSAAYLAAADGSRVTMKHLFHGTRRELQKMGRLVNEMDLIVESDRAQ